MLDRGTAAFTLATTAVALAALGALQWLLMAPGYPLLLVGPAVATALAAGVWISLRLICTGASGEAHAAAVAGIVLLCAWAYFGVSFGGAVAIPVALLLMVAHAVVPSPR